MLESLERDKHSSLFLTFVNYRSKKFYNIGTCIKLITGVKDFMMQAQGTLTEREGRLSTVALLIKVTCFVIKVDNIFNM